jgi:hypothetical protein
MTPDEIKKERERLYREGVNFVPNEWRGEYRWYCSRYDVKRMGKDARDVVGGFLQNME